MKKTDTDTDNDRPEFEDEFSLSDSGGFVQARRQSLDLRQTLAKQETQAVRCLRFIVFTILAAVATMFSIGAYLYMKKDEEDTFEEQFYDLAHRLVEGFQANAKLRVQVIHMFATSLTSTALQTDQIWPFVTIDDFDARAAAARAILGSRYLALYPIVNQELRRVWEEYTQDPVNLDWINQSFAFQEDFLATHNRNSSLPTYSRYLQQELEEEVESWHETDPYNNSIVYNGTYATIPQIYRAGDPNNPNDAGAWVYEDDDAPGPFYVMWQTSPTTQAEIWSINYNVLDPFYPSAYTDGISIAAETGDAVFAGVWNVDDDGYIAEDDDYNNRDVPISSILYPVFDKITGDDKKVVALLDLMVEFGPFFSSVLPSNSNSIVCVVSNCKQDFTFQITGETATYLGPSDLHDPKYDGYTVYARMDDFELSAAGTVYNGAPIDGEWCPWELRVYATQAMEEEFMTSKPIYYMTAVLGVFFFACLSFVAYDCLVEQRQAKVLTTAVKSDKIVSSLFPKTFREALYQADETKGKPVTTNKKLGMMIPRNTVDNIQDDTNSQRTLGEPLAQLYLNCTVFFADIAGFTAWSSARNPEQVFTLLETIYGAFDILAEKHNVFKIETIGDCYVAVTGLPEPQPNHAVLMVKFARDCLSKMSQLTRSLEATLGPDTSNLAMRVGMASGPVTAGVLRGWKARFQLFGDTVNTAARMESNGLKHCIHVSQETADTLVAMGKEHWVHAREDKIHAKGKGELQTYWIRPGSSGSVATRSLVSFEENVEVLEALDGLQDDTGEKPRWAADNFRRVEWAVDILFGILQELEYESPNVSQNSASAKPDIYSTHPKVEWSNHLLGSLTVATNGISSKRREFTTNEELRGDLKSYIVQLAYQGKSGYFHSFKHSCNVLLAAENMTSCFENNALKQANLKLSAKVKFALFLSSLIRDVAPECFALYITPQDEKPEGCAYNQSLVAAWKLLMDRKFLLLRQAVFSTTSEQELFLQLLVNMVSAGDVFRAIDCGENVEGSLDNKQVALILEHICLASQWSHTMQHTTNYNTWNDLLIQELIDEARKRHLDGDPVPQWRLLEQRLFDEAIVPVAGRLAHGGLLGATGDQLLTFAAKNSARVPLGRLPLLFHKSDIETQVEV